MGATVTTPPMLFLCDGAGRPLMSVPGPSSRVALRLCTGQLPEPQAPSGVVWSSLLSAVPALLIGMAVAGAIVRAVVRRVRRGDAPDFV